MVLESAQLLSTAVHLCGGEAPYKPNHVNHPCAIWTRQSKGNYKWLLQHFNALLTEYTARYGKVHKCSELLPLLSASITFIPDGERTGFVNCTRNIEQGIDYRHLTDVPLAYKMYLNDRWENDKRAPTWYRQGR